MTLEPKLTAIYLNDHLAGATAGRELAKRSLEANRGSELGRLLERLLREIEEDLATLRSVMDRVGARQDPAKRVAALAAERAGRLKLNGSLLGYSPLSRLIELEGLSLGVEGKAALWRALAEVDDDALAEFDFTALADRARRQRQELEAQRIEAARLALARSGASDTAGEGVLGQLANLYLRATLGAVRLALTPVESVAGRAADALSGSADAEAEDGAGARLAVDEPWEGYSRMNAADVVARIGGATEAELATIQLYESTHRGRKTVLAAAERELERKRSTRVRA